MKKTILVLLVSIFSAKAISQPVVSRSGSGNTVSDFRLQAALNFFAPRYVDTTSANVSKGIDSCGAMIFTYTNNTFYYRGCNPKRWIQFASGVITPDTWQATLNQGSTLTKNNTIEGGGYNFIWNSLDSLILNGDGTLDNRAVLSLDRVLNIYGATGVLANQSFISVPPNQELILTGNSPNGVIQLIPRYTGAHFKFRDIVEDGLLAQDWYNSGATMTASQYIENNSFTLRGMKDSTSIKLRSKAPAAVMADSSRFSEAYGAAVASSNNLTLGYDGNTFNVLGTTQINAIDNYAWQAGSVIRLKFLDAVTIKDNTAGGAGTSPIQLSGNVDYVTSAGDILQLLYDGTEWTEVGRFIAASPGGGNAWLLVGVSGTDSTINFLGTTDKKPLIFRVNNTEAGYIGTLSTTPVLDGIFVSNVALGYGAGPANKIPRGNIAIGTRALSSYSQTSQNLAAGNIAIGTEALRDYLGGGNEANLGIGFRALARTTTGIRNTAISLNAGHNNTTGNFGVFIGGFAGEWQSTGQANHAFGFGALRNNTIGVANTAVGPVALENQTGQIRTITVTNGGSGYTTASVSVTPYDAQPFGFLGQAQQCLATANVSGGAVVSITVTQIGRNYSSAIVTITGDGTGATATAVISSPNYNVAVGGNSGWGNQIGTDNVFVGGYSGYDSGGDQSSTIDNNMTFVGNYSSRDASVPTTTALTNATAIGYKAKVGKSNALVLGGVNGNRVDVGIGIVSPTATMQLSRTLTVNADDTTSGFKLTNPNPATVSLSNRSPSIMFDSYGWRTTGTASTHAYSQEYFNTFSGSSSPSGRHTIEVTLPQTGLTSKYEFVSGADFRINTPTSGTVLPRVSLYDGTTSTLVGQWYNNVGAAGRMGIYNGVLDGFIGLETLSGDGQQIRGFVNSSGMGSLYAVYAGVGTATPSAILEGSSTTRGFLMPRMTGAQMNAIASPATGLMVYCTDSTETPYCYYNGSTWLKVTSGGGSGGSGTVNSGTANRLAYYAGTGTAVSELAAITANRALISDANGLPTHSSVTNTELGYLSGVTSGLQTQIDGTVKTTGTQTVAGVKTFSSNPIFSAMSPQRLLYTTTGGEVTSSSGLTWDGTTLATTGGAFGEYRLNAGATNIRLGTSSGNYTYVQSGNGEALRFYISGTNAGTFNSNSEFIVGTTDNGSYSLQNNGNLYNSGNAVVMGALMPNNDAGTAGYNLTSAGAGSPPTWTASARLANTPTLTNGANVDNSSSLKVLWTRDGTHVTFSGTILINATAAGAAQVQIDIPYASDFASGDDASGTAVADGGSGVFDVGSIGVNVTTNRLVITVNASTLNDTVYKFTGSYEIL